MLMLSVNIRLLSGIVSFVYGSVCCVSIFSLGRLVLYLYVCFCELFMNECIFVLLFLCSVLLVVNYFLISLVMFELGNGDISLLMWKLVML